MTARPWLRNSVLAGCLALLLVTTAGVGRSAAAPAVPNQALTLSPSAARPSVSPGQTASGSFQIINAGSQPTAVTIYAAPYSVTGEDYNPDFNALPGKPVVADWFRFSTKQAMLQANESLTIRYTISVPAGTQPGGYYAAAFARTQAPPTTNGVIINEQVGELFYLHVAGPVVRSGKLTSWSSAWLQQRPLTATLRLQDDGGIDYNSAINVKVSDIFGHQKYQLASQKEILPQTVRRITVSWPGAPAFGLFKVGGTITVFDKGQQLPTKYVLVMSPLARVIFGIVVAAVIALTVFKATRKRRPAASFSSGRRR